MKIRHKNILPLLIVFLLCSCDFDFFGCDLEDVPKLTFHNEFYGIDGPFLNYHNFYRGTATKKVTNIDCTDEGYIAISISTGNTPKSIKNDKRFGLSVTLQLKNNINEIQYKESEIIKDFSSSWYTLYADTEYSCYFIAPIKCTFLVPCFLLIEDLTIELTYIIYNNINKAIFNTPLSSTGTITSDGTFATFNGMSPLDYIRVSAK